MQTTIKNWDEEERPREKLMSKGAGALTNVELLAILLNTGTRDKSAVDLGRAIIESASGRLTVLSSFSIDNLTAIPGVGNAKAVAVAAAFELGRRIACESPDELMEIDSSRIVADMMIPRIGYLDYEECWVFFLNKANRCLSREKMSGGGSDSTILDFRLILKRAVSKGARSIIVVHNHPSGNPHPSRQDCIQTKALHDAASLLDIKLTDHVIVAGNKYFSFSDNQSETL